MEIIDVYALTAGELEQLEERINEDLRDTATRRLELLKEIKEMLGYCPFCWANFNEPCADKCKMGKELADA